MAAESAALILGVAQVVVPVAVAVTPYVWRKTVGILKALQMRMSGTPEDNEYLSIIRTLMEKLERISWNLVPKAGSLLVKLQSQAISLKKMIENFSRFQRNRISKRIKSIALILRILDNIAGGGPAEDQVTEFYQKHKENLCKDLLDIVSKDEPLQPLQIHTQEVKTFPGIRYPRTLTVSSSAIDCIEHLLKWLRDLALMQGTMIIRGSIDVALYEVFTEILPQVLMEHLDRRRFGPIETKQFLTNVCFLRSFSQSSTFREIQGEAGLKLESEEKIDVDLCLHDWTTWNNLQQRIEIELSKAGLPPRNDLQQQQRRDSYRASASRSTTSSECVFCGLHLQGNNSVELEKLIELHYKGCVKREERLMSHMSWPEMKNKAGLDRNEKRRSI